MVTRFEFELYPVGPEVLSGLIVFPLADAKSALKQYREKLAKEAEARARAEAEKARKAEEAEKSGEAKDDSSGEAPKGAPENQ